MEQHIVAHNAGLSGALLVGTGSFQAALLIEPACHGEAGRAPPTTAEQAALIEQAWPSVHAANTTTPERARVDKALILVTKPDRPLVRDSNGTVQHGASAAQYAAELEALRADAEFGPRRQRRGRGRAARDAPLVFPRARKATSRFRPGVRQRRGGLAARGRGAPDRPSATLLRARDGLARGAPPPGRGAVDGVLQPDGLPADVCHPRGHWG